MKIEWRSSGKENQSQMEEGKERVADQTNAGNPGSPIPADEPEDCQHRPGQWDQYQPNKGNQSLCGDGCSCKDGVGNRKNDQNRDGHDQHHKRANSVTRFHGFCGFDITIPTTSQPRVEDSPRDPVSPCIEEGIPGTIARIAWSIRAYREWRQCLYPIAYG